MTNTFAHFQSLSKKSETLRELIKIKNLDDENSESIRDKRYTQAAFKELSTHYIQAIDNNQITFQSEGDRRQFIWLLGLITDFALDGRLKDLIAHDPKTQAIIYNFPNSAAQ